jgi:aspartate racemase
MGHIIGIIGGNGVAATNRLCELIEQRITKSGATRDAHHPQMIIHQATQVPSRSMYLEGRGPSFVPDYISIGRMLRDAGAEILALCCNTSHYAINEIETEVGLPFINVIELVIRSARDSGANTFGMMVTEGSRKFGIYDQYFAELFPAARLIYPERDFQDEINRGICNVKNSCRFLPSDHPDRPRNIFQRVYDHLFDSGSEMIIAGCTDISVDFPCDQALDSLSLLADSIVTIHNNGLFAAMDGHNSSFGNKA